MHMVTLAIVLSTLFSSGLSASDPGKPYVSIQALIEKRQIEATFKSVGGHQGDCITSSFQNKTNDTLYVTVEAGRRLIAADSLNQDILLVRTEKIAIPPSGKAEQLLNGYCCQSHDHSPPKDAVFKVGRMASQELVLLAQLIEKNKFPVDAVQHSIWCIADNIPITSITDEDLKSITPLRRAVASLKHTEMPWYVIQYKKDTAQLFTDRPVHIKGDVPYYLSTNSMVTIQIREKGGRIKASLKSELPADKGDQLFLLDLNVASWNKGEYELLIIEDGSRLNSRKSFTL
jgi:hypothetical protein